MVTLLTPTVPPPMGALFAEAEGEDGVTPRGMTRRLVEALGALRQATERAAAGADAAFGGAVNHGVSANLCEALIQLIEPFPTLDIGVSWARTRPVTESGTVVRFGAADAPLLGEAARSLRERAPRPDMRLYGFVRLLKRAQDQDDGTIGLVTAIEGKRRSVTAVLERQDHERAVKAHGERAVVVLAGDLERFGRRWRLLNPRLTEVIRDDGLEFQQG